MQIVNVEHKHLISNSNLYASISDKIILKVRISDVIIVHHYIIIVMLDLKNSIWQLIHTRTLSYDMSTVYFMPIISKWKTGWTLYIIIALKGKEWQTCWWCIVYQILTAFRKLRIMSDTAHYNSKILKLFTSFINKR